MAVVIIAACVASLVTAEGAFLREERDCVCPTNYQPVCANLNGRTTSYSNGCQATCSGATVLHGDLCSVQECACSRQYKPVCGDDNVDYDNSCLASCRGATVKHQGQCRRVQVLPVDDKRTAEDNPCICTTELNVVCASDGQTYGNPCFARCNKHVTVEHVGPCISDGVCPCPAIYSPVCGADGKQYATRCLAECRGVNVDFEGPCQQSMSKRITGRTKPNRVACVCTTEFKLVCGLDGNDYSNPCHAECNGTSVRHDGSCISTVGECACPQIYSPVCGVDGNSYNNDCIAVCRGVRVAHYGTCNRPQPLPASVKRQLVCLCTQERNEVCGSDGQMYANECVAKCSGATVEEDKGKCHSL